MKPNTEEEVIDLSELVYFPPPAQPVPIAASAGAGGTSALELNARLIEITERVAPLLRKGTLHAFIELHYLLKYSDLIEDCIEQGGELGRTVLFLKLIKSRGNSLVDKINSFA